MHLLALTLKLWVVFFTVNAIKFEHSREPLDATSGSTVVVVVTNPRSRNYMNGRLSR